ncbi:alpha-hydroxy acid oxidase [Treponema sp.]|uniref:alpha-hydroxy acid oxidase n=1 Tax=Treponema sp. TaxID=166 RepID=UPI00298E55C6|nr:alpha-hydroxy acid oxidase [Treponema sp.]MCQ2241673.1 alpha-hydroxy-acid oxidizing protein [Treponema sp.]
MEYSSNSDKITREYFDSLLLETRYLDSALPCTKMELFGETFDTPIMTAALSHLGNTAPDGMKIYAQAAKQANAVHWVGMGEDEELEDIISTGAKTIKIIKPHEDNAEVFRKIEHAVGAGCFAVGMDIDHSFNGKGGYDNVLGLPMKAKSTEELAEFVQAAKISFVVKGVQSAKDAVKCLKAGCAGIVISHHHNMMAYSVPPLFVLPEILSAVSNEIPVFVDCGIESGMDAYKALALGATAVSVGRHLMPLLKEGPDKVAARIVEMNNELAGVMSRTGVKSLSEMDPTVIHKRNF